MRNLLVTFLTILSLQIKFENLILFFYFVQCSTVALKTTFGILRFPTGVYVDIRRPQPEKCYHTVFNKILNLFHKVPELPSHYPFGWTFLSTYRHLTFYPHSIICSFITHAHCTFSHSMKTMVLYCLALLQIGLLKDVSKLIYLPI